MREYWYVKRKEDGHMWVGFWCGSPTKEQRTSWSYAERVTAYAVAASQVGIVVHVTMKKRERKPIGWVNRYPNLGLVLHTTEKDALSASSNGCVETFPVYR